MKDTIVISGTTSINDLVSQIKVPVSLTSCQKLLSAAANATVSSGSGTNTIVSGGLITTGIIDGSSASGGNTRYISKYGLEKRLIIRLFNYNIYLHGESIIIFYFLISCSSGTTALIANQGQLNTGSVTTAIQQSTGRRRKAKNQAQLSSGE